MATKNKKSKTNGDQPTGEIGTHLQSMHAMLGCSSNDLDFVLQRYSSFKHRDTMWQRFGINRSEMWALWTLKGYLTAQGRSIVSQQKFIDSLSGTFNQQRKFFGYMKGLATLGCVGCFEYVNSPGSLSVGISDLGFEILSAYSQELNKLFGKYNKEELHIQRFPKTISIAENLPISYVHRQSA